ncbi:MAG: DUF3857 and transglutaminase domain-containing protein [Cyclobacteriaceae bacterium]|nr:DUF3857 and transglutaminase domain-containing protein [Cyclobacteriaceae bacterium]
MKSFLFAVLTVIPLLTYAQKSPIKYGDIPMEDLKMTVYGKDSSAAAVVLVDFGIALIKETNGETGLSFERHTRIKILTKDGLEWADGSILTFHNNSGEERISNFKATAYNLENGKIVETKISKDGIFKEKFNKNFNRQKFTIPNVKVGTVIEYSYTKNSEFFTDFPSWQFQRTIPTKLSEYWALVPEVFVYEKYMQGYVAVTRSEEKRMTYYNFDVKAFHYVSENVPAFKKEPFMTSTDDYISRVNYALAYYKQKEIMGTWEKLKADLMIDDNFGKVIDGSGFLKEKVETLTAGITDPLKKIEVISDWIKQNVEYDGEEDFLALPLKKIVEKKKGTSGDINLLMASMLDKAGLETDMILLSTRDHGFIRKQFPMTKQFNYVVCLVRLEDKNLFLDATEKYLPFDVLPDRCLNGEGMVVSKKNFGWINVATKTKARTAVNADLKLDASGELTGKLSYAKDGYDAQGMRQSYIKNGEEAYLKNFMADKQWQITKSEFQDIKELGKQTREAHTVTIAEHTSQAGDVIYVNPFVALQFTENPFKTETRIYPVDFGTPIDRTYICKIVIPDGYVVDELPKSKLLALPANAGKYLYNASQIGNTISITSTFLINRTLFVQDEYPSLREFYNQVVAKQAEQIVIKKKQ